MTEPELFTAPLCPFVMRVRLALIEKGIEAPEVEIDLRNKPCWFLDMAPLGELPVLRHGGNVISDSAIICEYLDEAFPDIALLPREPQLRAQARIWTRFFDTRIYGRTKALLLTFGKPADASILAELGDGLRFIEQQAFAWHDGPYLLGSDICLADLALYPWFEQLAVIERYFGFELPAGIPCLTVWRETLAHRSSVRAACKSADYYVEAYGALARKLTAATA